MNILIAVGAFNALFLAILIQTKKSRVLADYILFIFLFLTSVAFALVFGALEYGHEGLLLFLIFSNLFFAPLFYLYVRAMVNPEQAFHGRSLLMFIPWMMANLYLLQILDSFDSSRMGWFFGEAGFSDRPFIYNFAYLLDLVAVPLFLGLSWVRLKRHKRQIARCFSDHQGIDYAWLNKLIAALAVSWVIIEVPLLASQLFDSVSENLSLVLGFSLLSLMVFYLGYHGFRQAVVFSAKEMLPGNSVEEDSSYSRSGLDDEETKTYQTALLKIMGEKRPYLNNDLTLGDLAGLVGLTEHNISEVINVGVGISFFDFINGYRVDEFKERVVQPENKNMTFLSLALECGFSSKSSFNRVFKKMTGLTPSQFRKSFPAK